MAVDQADDEDDETERQAETQRQLQMLQQLQSMQRGGGYSAPAQPSASSARAPTQSSNVASANRDKSHLRVDNCLKFEVKSTPSSYGDATVTNACNFTIQYSFCYQGGTGKLFDCGGSPRDRGSDSLGPGSKHDLPEYKRDRNTGLTAVACRGAVGDVLPLISNSGRPPGCY